MIEQIYMSVGFHHFLLTHKEESNENVRHSDNIKLSKINPSYMKRKVVHTNGAESFPVKSFRTSAHKGKPDSCAYDAMRAGNWQL